MSNATQTIWSYERVWTSETYEDWTNRDLIETLVDGQPLSDFYASPQIAFEKMKEAVEEMIAAEAEAGVKLRYAIDSSWEGHEAEISVFYDEGEPWLYCTYRLVRTTLHTLTY